MTKEQREIKKWIDKVIDTYETYREIVNESIITDEKGLTLYYPVTVDTHYGFWNVADAVKGEVTVNKLSKEHYYKYELYFTYKDYAIRCYTDMNVNPLLDKTDKED